MESNQKDSFLSSLLSVFLGFIHIVDISSLVLFIAEWLSVLWICHTLFTTYLLMDIYTVSNFLAITIKLYEYFFASFNVDMSLVFLGKYLSQ